MKVEARPETFEDHGPGVKNIALGGLKNPLLRYNLNTKGVPIPGGMTKMVGSSGKTLPWPDMAEVVGPEIMGAFSANKKVGTLIGGRPDKDITCPEIVDNVGTALTSPTEHRFLDEEMANI